MKLYTLVYIYDRDCDVKVKTFETKRNALDYKNRLVVKFAEDHSGIKHYERTIDTSKEMMYLFSGAYVDAQIHIIETEL